MNDTYLIVSLLCFYDLKVILKHLQKKMDTKKKE